MPIPYHIKQKAIATAQQQRNKKQQDLEKEREEEIARNRSKRDLEEAKNRLKTFNTPQEQYIKNILKDNNLTLGRSLLPFNYKEFYLLDRLSKKLLKISVPSNQAESELTKNEIQHLTKLLNKCATQKYYIIELLKQAQIMFYIATAYLFLGISMSFEMIFINSLFSNAILSIIQDCCDKSSISEIVDKLTDQEVLSCITSFIDTPSLANRLMNFFYPNDRVEIISTTRSIKEYLYGSYPYPLPDANRNQNTERVTAEEEQLCPKYKKRKNQSSEQNLAAVQLPISQKGNQNQRGIIEAEGLENLIHMPIYRLSSNPQVFGNLVFFAALGTDLKMTSQEEERFRKSLSHGSVGSNNRHTIKWEKARGQMQESYVFTGKLETKPYTHLLNKEELGSNPKLKEIIEREAQDHPYRVLIFNKAENHKARGF